MCVIFVVVCYILLCWLFFTFFFIFVYFGVSIHDTNNVVLCVRIFVYLCIFVSKEKFFECIGKLKLYLILATLESLNEIKFIRWKLLWWNKLNILSFSVVVRKNRKIRMNVAIFTSKMTHVRCVLCTFALRLFTQPMNHQKLFLLLIQYHFTIRQHVSTTRMVKNIFTITQQLIQ